jgi:hypothetical protein
MWCSVPRLLPPWNGEPGGAGRGAVTANDLISAALMKGSHVSISAV